MALCAANLSNVLTKLIYFPLSDVLVKSCFVLLLNSNCYYCNAFIVLNMVRFYQHPPIGSVTVNYHEYHFVIYILEIVLAIVSAG